VGLNAFASGVRKRIFEDLTAGNPPGVGEYSQELLKEARAKGKPQMGSTTYLPNCVNFEFIYSGSSGAATLLTVSVQPPERIVYLPVPEWVIQQIWQGEVFGSYQLLSDGERMLDHLRHQLLPEPNREIFP
jgi:hypothetical protein